MPVRVLLSLLGILASAQAASSWNCSSGPGVLSLDTRSLAYSYAINGRTWLEDGDFVVHCGGYRSFQQGELAVVSQTASQESFSATFKIVDAAQACDFPVTFTFHCDGYFLSFETAFPQGADGPLLSTQAENGPTPAGYESSYSPLTHFPSWLASNSSFLNSGALSHIEWAGTFAWQELNRDVGLFPHTNKSFSPGNGQLTGYFGGQTGGPVVIHETSWDRAQGERPAALFVTPAASFKHSILALQGEETLLRWVFGPQGQLTSLPAGWSTSLAFFPSADGINDAVYRGGQTLQLLYNKTANTIPLAEDVGSAYVSVWTDNGAFYCWSYFDQQEANATWLYPAAANVLTAIQSYWQDDCVQDSRGESPHYRYDKPCSKLQSIQLDPWEWHGPLPAEALTNWTADPRLFGPSGLVPLAQAGLRFTAYFSFWNQASQVTMPPFTFVDSVFFNGSWMPLPFSQVQPSQSLAFHKMLIQQRALPGGAINSETDFLDWSFMAMPSHQQQVDSFDEWMRGLDGAMVLSTGNGVVGVGKRLPLQLCMALASDVLNSLTLQTPTNYRVSQDNDFHYAPATRWSIGISSLLVGAFGLRPFFDVTWTRDSYPSSLFPDTAYDGIQHNSVELSVILSVLSTGPVGIGDAVGATNKTLVRATCRADGLLLKPSLPLAAMDLTFLYPAPPLGQENWNTSMVAMQAGTWIPSSSSPSSSTGPPFVHVVVVDAAEPVVVYPSDIYPSILTPFFSYVAVPWSPGFAEMETRCGAAGGGGGDGDCFVPFNQTSPLTVQTGGPSPPPPGISGEGFHPFEMLTLHPVSSSGFGVIGTLDKIARVSPQRFAAIDYLTDGLTATVTGVEGEELAVVFIVPSPSAIDTLPLGLATTTVNITIPSDGAAVKIACSVGSSSASGSCGVVAVL